MRQTWHDLLFAHWRVDAAALAPMLPPALELETFDGSAWFGVVPFGMRGVRIRGLPEIPGTSAFLELNVRTYVRMRGANSPPRPGVWFFSLDAANRLAVLTARRWFQLPYFFARMNMQKNDAAIVYESIRHDSHGAEAEFRGGYSPEGNVYHSAAGSIEHWLTERYCLYSADARGRLHCGEIHHAPWPLQNARCSIQSNTMAAPHGVSLARDPDLLHFARELSVLIWPLRRIS
ncbi:MAG: DUF2071 domain-containing protein [Planctomycetes bacterium]|nr:DUF2071 domain-containing protein [Planctomycetota bacterium]